MEKIQKANSQAVNTDAVVNIEDLNTEAVMAAACQATGLDDYGDEEFIEGLTILLKSIRTEGRLNQQGIVAVFQDMVRMLSNRLLFQRDIKLHPEILDEEIVKPIVITGLPRTGTSKLQRMISADPDVQRLEVWRLLFPARLQQNDDDGAPDPRIALADQYEATLKANYPEFMAGHPMEAREPDEELWLLQMTFASPDLSVMKRAPSHRIWVERQSQLRSYAYLRKLLQYLQWQDGGARGRPWILKSPLHIGELQTLFESFPDATVVHCHRHPEKVVASFCSLLEVIRRMHSDDVDLHELGVDLLSYLKRLIDRGLVARREMDDDSVLDVYYEDICDDAESVIEGIYAEAGRAVSQEAANAFRDYEKRRPQGYFGKHTYSLEDYGLSGEKIEEAFADYLREYPRLNKERK